MKYIIIISLIFIGITTSSFTYSQGCSDAGVCTINNIKDHSMVVSHESGDRNYFKSGISYGIGEYDITMINPYIEYTGIFTKRVSLSGKLTYAFVSGELANTNNLADLFFSTGLTLIDHDNNFLNMVLGAKIPLNNSNIKEKDSALPMHYQSSLGTYDLIVGVNYTLYNVGISIALQQPIINSNKNEFFKPTDQTSKEYKYSSTNSYKRSGDVVLRASYNFHLFENRFFFRPGLLAIYHLADDSYTDQSNMEQEITGSQGLTLNGNVFLGYKFSSSKQLELSLGMPFITRDTRPDGLTRELVSGLEYIYSF